MPKLFLATSFSGKVNYDTSQVFPEFRKEVEELLAELRTIPDTTVFCAMEDERWLISSAPPEVGVKKDLEEIDKADIVLTLLHGIPSTGVQFEIGYAVAKGKKVLLAAQTEEPLAYFNQGVANAGLATHVFYASPKELAEKVTSRLSE